MLPNPLDRPEPLGAAGGRPPQRAEPRESDELCARPLAPCSMRRQQIVRDDAPLLTFGRVDLREAGSVRAVRLGYT